MVRFARTARHQMLTSMLALALTALHMPASAQVAAPPLGATVDRYLSRLDALGFSGVVLVAQDGKVILERGGYGLAERQERAAYTAATVFDIGSITKQFTAAAILKLEMAGKLSNGGLLSTVGDLYKWHQALLGDAVLSKAAKEKYFAPHVAEDPSGSSHYGYGWVIEKTPRGTSSIAHNGGNGVFAADFQRYVDEGAAIIAGSAQSNFQCFSVSLAVRGLVFGGEIRMPLEMAIVDAGALGRYAGNYALASGGQAVRISTAVGIGRCAGDLFPGRVVHLHFGDNWKFGIVRTRTALAIDQGLLVLAVSGQCSIRPATDTLRTSDHQPDDIRHGSWVLERAVDPAGE